MQELNIVCHECNKVNTVIIKDEIKLYECDNCKADLDDPFPVEVDDESCFQHIQENHIPMLVDFYSTTCGPCMAMYDDYEDAALAFSLKVRFLKINADKHQELAKKYKVGALPTIIAFKDGEEVNRISRQLSAVELGIWAESLIS